MLIFGEQSTFSLHLLDENHGRKRAHDSKLIIMLIVIMLVPRDLPQVPPPTTTNLSNQAVLFRAQARLIAGEGEKSTA